MSLIAEAFVRVRPDLTGFQQDVRQKLGPGLREIERSLGQSNREFSRFGRGALVGTGALRQLGRAAAFASASFIGGAGLVVTMKNASQAASNLNEQLSKSSVVFGTSAAAIESWSQTSATALGLARDQAVEAAAGFGALLRPLGATQAEAADTSTKLVQLAADLASFSNTPVPQALDAIRSGLVGEIEPLRRYGVVLSEAAVQQAALKETGKDSVQQLTAQEKVQARLALIFKQTALAQGDYARTADGLANSERTLQAHLRDVSITLGQALNPQIARVVGNLNKWLENTDNQERLQRDINEAVKTGTEVVEGLASGIEHIHDVTQPVIDVLGGLKNTIEAVLVAGFVAKAARAARAIAGIGAAERALTTVVVAESAKQQAAMAGAFTGGGKGAVPIPGKGGGGITFWAALATFLGYKTVFPQGISGVSAPITSDTTGANGSPFPKGTTLDDLYQKQFKQIAAAARRIDAGRESTRSTADLRRQVLQSFTLERGRFLLGRPLTAAEQRALALARTGGTGTSAEVQAISAELTADQRALAYAQKQLDTRRGNTRAFFEQAQRLEEEIRAGQDRLQAIRDQNAAKADEAARKAKAAAEKALQRQIRAGQDAFRGAGLGAGGALAVVNGVIVPRSMRLLAARVQQRIADTRQLGTRGGLLGGFTPGLTSEQSLELQIAEARAKTDADLLPVLRRALSSLQTQEQLLRLGKAKREQILQVVLAEEQIKARIRDTRAKAAAAQGFTLTEFFAEAGREQQLYGSDIGAAGMPLSAQDARASIAQNIKAGPTVHVHITQEQPNLAQSIAVAANAARALR